MKSPCLLLIIVAVFGSVVVTRAQPTVTVPNCSGNATADTAALTKLLTSLGSANPATIQFPSKTDPTELCRLNSITFSSNITLDFTYGGVQIVTGQSFTAQGPLIAPAKQVFFNALTGQGTVVTAGTVYPDWWASNTAPGTTDMTAAINAADASVCSGALNSIDGVTVTAQGIVKFKPSTTYKHTGVIYRGAPWDLQGSVLDYYGSGASITAAGTSSARKNLSIVNGTIYGAHASAGARGISLGWNMRSYGALRQVKISHFPSHGIYFADDEWDMSFYDVAIVACATTSGTGIGFAAVNNSNHMDWYNLVLENNGAASSGLGGGIDTSTAVAGSVHQWAFFGGLLTSNLGLAEANFVTGSNINFYGNYIESEGTGQVSNGLLFNNVTAVGVHDVFLTGNTNTGSAIHFKGSTTGVVDNPRIASNWTTTLNAENAAIMQVTSLGSLVPGTSVVNDASTTTILWPANQVLRTTSGVTYATIDTTGNIRVSTKIVLDNSGVVNWGRAADYGTLTWDTGKAIVQAKSGKALSLSANGTLDQLWLSTAGKLGIGTNNPGSALTVNGNIGFTTSSTGAGVLADSATAPIISSGFGTSPSIVASNGTIAFAVGVGTGGTASAGVIGMPAATTGWICKVENQTGVASNRADQRTVQTASTTKTVTVQNQTVSSGAALAWTAYDVLTLQCRAY